MTDELKQQHQFMDLFSQGWTQDYAVSGGRVYCGKGCSSCCTLVVNCTYEEALLVSRSADRQQLDKTSDTAKEILACAAAAPDFKSWLGNYRKKVGHCPFLDSQGGCGIYRFRPLSCRSLISTAEPRWCATDFSMLDHHEKQQYMDGLDRAVVSFPTHYAATLLETGKDLEQAALERMKSVYGFSVSGNLPYLVWLEDQHNLETVFSTGLKPSIEYLTSRDLLHPYLISFEE